MPSRDSSTRPGVRMRWPSVPNEAGGSAYWIDCAHSALWIAEPWFQTTSRCFDW